MGVGDVVSALVLGFFFGWLLQKAHLTHYEKIANVFRFTDLAVLKFMLAALATGMVFVRLFIDLGWFDPALVNPTYIAGNLVGGAIFGIGMAAAGLCPGTTVAGAGRGNLDYLIPGFLGFLTGGALFGITYPYFFPKLSGILKVGSVNLAQVIGVSPWLLILFLVEFTLLLFYVIERLDLRRADKLRGETPARGRRESALAPGAAGR